MTSNGADGATIPNSPMASPNSPIASPTEETSLLGTNEPTRHSSGFLQLFAQERKPHLTTRVLPLAFVGGFGIAGTVAAIMSVYMYLICEDAKQCTKKDKKEELAKTVATATTVTNVLSVLLLGPMQRVGRRSRRAGLGLWLVARGLSLAVFLIAVAWKSLIFAFIAQALEGASTDGLLHFNLNAAYVENAPDTETPRLFGLSLGLFMVGLAVGPAVTGLFADPRLGFYIGTAMFAAALVYVMSPLVPWRKEASQVDECAVEDNFRDWSRAQREGGVPKKAVAGAASVIEPLLFFSNHPGAILHGLSLLAFTSGQAFFFPALVVHATTNFAFDGQQISTIVTAISVAGSLNLLTIVVLLPALSTRICNLTPRIARLRDRLSRHLGWDTAWACWSMLVFSIAVLSLLVVREGRELYVMAIFCSFGNATPPFVKSHISRRLPVEVKAMALAALALCETTGSLLSPVLIGTAQAHGDRAGFPVFAVVTSGLVMAAGISFSVAAWGGYPALPLEAKLVGEGDDDGVAH